MTWGELACHDAARTPYPPAWRTSRLPKLAAVFEHFRRDVGGTLTVGCGYRTPAHNKLKGGVKLSQHVQGRALDLYTPKGWRRARFHDLAGQIAQANRSVGAIGYYRWGVHIDTRPRGPRLIGWGSSSAKIRI